MEIAHEVRNKKFLVIDRDPLFTQGFRDILESAGITCVKTTVASPNMNPYAERFVRSIKSECLNRMLIFSESHLRHLINEYMEHYHTERPRQGIGNEIIELSTTG